MYNYFHEKAINFVFFILYISIMIHLSCQNKVDDKLPVEDRLKKYNELISESPDDLNLLRERAIIYSKLNNQDSALSDINRCIDGGLEDHKLYDLKGNILYHRKDYLKAIESYTKAIKLLEEDTIALLYRASCFEAIRNYDNAINDYKKLIDLAKDGKYCNAYGITRSISLCHIFKGEYEKAIESYKQGIRFLSCAEEDTVCNQTISDIYRDIAILYSLCDDYQSAFEKIDLAVKCLSKSYSAGSNVYYHRALIFLKLYNVEQAKQNMVKIHEQYGSDFPFYYIAAFYMSLYYADMGDIITSKKYLKEAVEKGFEYFDLIPIREKYYHLQLEVKKHRKLKNQFLKRKMIDKIFLEDRICNSEELNTVLLDRLNAIIYSEQHKFEYSKLLQLCREYGYFGGCK